jgi:hypothetical protein
LAERRRAPRWINSATRAIISFQRFHGVTCQHRGFVSERELVRFGIKPGTPVAQFVKRLRCRKCGSGSVMAQRSASKTAVA